MRSCPPVPVPSRLEGSPPRKLTGLAGERWRSGHRPEEFRSLGRLSASELCSLPMVLAAEERRNGRRPLGRRGDREGAGDRDAEATQAALWGWRAQPRRGRGRRGTGEALFGEGRARRCGGATHRSSALFRETQGKEAGKRRAPAAPAGGTAFTHSLGRRTLVPSRTRIGGAGSAQPSVPG